MNLVTQAEFARMVGVTRQAIRDAYLKGRLKKYDKKIDLDDETTKDYLISAGRTARKTKPKKTAKKPAKKPAKRAPKPRKKKHIVSGNRVIEQVIGEDDATQVMIEDVGSDTDDDEFDEAVKLEKMTRRKIERQKLIEQVTAMQVKTAKERMELIERALVHRVYSKLYAVHTSELHPLGDKISADLAAMFGSDDSEAALSAKNLVDKNVFRALQHIKRLMNDFFESVRSEGI